MPSLHRGQRLPLMPTTVLAGALLALVSCGQEGASSDGIPGAQSTPPPASIPAEELTPGWDESPDGPPAKPDAELTDAELKKLLRTHGPAAGAETCGPGDVTATLSGFDVATGSRYTSVVVTNTSKRPCAVDGIAGLGVRGDWGHTFTNTIEDGYLSSGDPAVPVRLAPGEAARAQLQWTGNLAANDAERASLLVVQLAKGQVPLRVEPRIVLPDYEETLDVGMLTTLRLAPFEPAS